MFLALIQEGIGMIKIKSQTNENESLIDEACTWTIISTGKRKKKRKE